MKRRIVISTVTAVALAAGGSAAAFAGSADSGHGAGGDSRQATHTSSARAAQPSARSSVQLKDRNEDAREAAAAKLTAPQAASAAHKAVSGTVTGIDLDNDRQGLVWETDVVKKGTEHEVVLDAGTGKVLAQHRDGDGDGDDAKLPSGAKVSAADAARKAAGHGTVTSVGLEDNGTWEVETTDKQHHEHDLTVDPHSGKVTPQHSDDEDDGDDD